MHGQKCWIFRGSNENYGYKVILFQLCKSISQMPPSHHVNPFLIKYFENNTWLVILCWIYFSGLNLFANTNSKLGRCISQSQLQFSSLIISSFACGSSKTNLTGQLSLFSFNLNLKNSFCNNPIQRGGGKNTCARLFHQITAGRQQYMTIWWSVNSI